VKPDAWNLYCDAFRALFPRGKVDDAVSPAALQEMVDRLVSHPSAESAITPATPKQIYEALPIAERWKGVFSDESHGFAGKNLGILARAVIALHADNIRAGAELTSRSPEPATTPSGDGISVVTAALVMARATLERWANLYGKWATDNRVSAMQLDRRLPPAEQVRTLEAIEVALSLTRGSTRSATASTTPPEQENG
jgi:hypothetical protein